MGHAGREGGSVARVGGRDRLGSLNSDLRPNRKRAGVYGDTRHLSQMPARLRLGLGLCAPHKSSNGIRLTEMTMTQSSKSSNDSSDAAEDVEDAGVKTPADEQRRFARARARRRRVLLVAMGIVALGVLLQIVGPCLRPVDIDEGPMLQGQTATSSIVVWTMTQSVDTTFSCRDSAGNPVSFMVERDGKRNLARLTGLLAGASYAYEIRGNDGTEFHVGTLSAAKPAGAPFSFAVFGDSGEASRAQYLIASRIASVNPDFIVHTGDLVYPDGKRSRYGARFFEPYKELLARIPFWPSLGNHDVSKENQDTAYRPVFELPENGPADQPAEDNYWFDYGDARFAVLNSNLNEPELANSIAPWLEQTMTNTTARWKFVVFHHPAYTSGKYPPTERIVNAIVPVMDRARVDVVFSGHDHMYERTVPLRSGEPTDIAMGGITYIVSGAGGAPLYVEKYPQQRPPWIAMMRNDRHSFSKIQIDGGLLQLQQIDFEGEVLDEITISK